MDIPSAWAMGAGPPIEKLGVIGDRRTAAMVAADGTLNWLCLPDYDSPPLFGALLDADKGGLWRLWPEDCEGQGQQLYRKDTTTLTTTWENAAGEVELADMMLWPENQRTPVNDTRRVVLRRMTCRRGTADCAMHIAPRDDFGAAAEVTARPGGARFQAGDRGLSLWTSFSLDLKQDAAVASFRLSEGETAWAILELGLEGEEWTVDAASGCAGDTEAYWRRWTHRLTYLGPRQAHVRRSAMTFHLLSYAPTGALVAAPTTSLPERISGDRNYDYRYAWIRDVSLSMAILGMLGDIEAAERYMDWLCGLSSSNEMPLQVLYRIDGGLEAPQRARDDIAGYRNSRPVLFGNHAIGQRQIDSFGYLADCSLIYLQQGGPWKPEYWRMIRRLADYTAETWREPGQDIWELGEPRHFVSSKVMAWVTLERAVQIAARQGEDGDIACWTLEMDAIRAEVMDRGWSEAGQTFRQHYDTEAVDASVLLMAMLGFLSPDDPKLVASVARIEERLTRDGLVYRFDPQEIPSPLGLPLGEAEGAFLPCTFWLAAVLAMQGQHSRAEAILARVEAAAGDLGLFAEEIDPASGAFLGNTPLLFSHAEYLKAVLELAKAQPLGRVSLMASQVLARLRRWLPSPTN